MLNELFESVARQQRQVLGGKMETTTVVVTYDDYDQIKRERDEAVRLMREINVMACYASEENLDARLEVLIEIGNKARAFLAKHGG